MAISLLGLAKKSSADIDCRGVVRGDVVPWALSGALMTLLYIAMVYTVVIASHESVTFARAAANLSLAPFLALAVLGSVVARRSRDIWTWVLAVVLILFFARSTHTTLAAYWLPNGPLTMVCAMLGLLAAGRIVEYLHMRYVIQLQEPRLTTGGWVTYLLLTVVALGMNSALIFDLLVNNLLLRF